MPEGPSILLMKENLEKFTGQQVLSVRGNARTDKEILAGETLCEIRTFGKQTYLIFEKSVVRVHLLMFGSYSVDEQIRPEKSVRLYLQFERGEVYFYTCSVKMVTPGYLEDISWEADVLSDKWDPEKAADKVIKTPHRMVCDVLLDQDIFAGVGNIIKNEVLFRIKIQPESLIGDLPKKKIADLVYEARNYSFDFLNWKREFVLKKHWLVHNKKFCPLCDSKLIRKHTGTMFRRSFYCETDQKLY